jgi:hypothetical protein
VPEGRSRGTWHLGHEAVLTGVPGRQAFVEMDLARLMRDMVLKNQVLLGRVNAGPEASASSLQKLELFRHRWPHAVQTIIAGRYPAERATELILGRPIGIKTVIAFGEQRTTGSPSEMT